MSDEHTIMLHAHDAKEDGPIHEASAIEDVLRADVACPRCAVRPLDVRAYPGSDHWGDHAVHCAVHCVACEKHVGTSKTRVGSIWGREEDLRMLGGRARVYGASRAGTHGDLAHAQHNQEIALERAKRGGG